MRLTFQDLRDIIMSRKNGKMWLLLQILVGFFATFKIYTMYLTCILCLIYVSFWQTNKKNIIKMLKRVLLFHINSLARTESDCMLNACCFRVAKVRKVIFFVYI